ncbi:MAG: 30S ribosomal protein S16 [Dehalococcoidia bacterium]|nr:30S ribosomal protein S16 [Dehalococcoidia bacterium]
MLLLRIRLRRTGRKKLPSYRVVVADQNAPRDGAFVEIVGHYNPRTEPRTVELKEDRIKHWLSVGAQPTETVHRLIYERGLWDVAPRKLASKPSKAEARAEAEARAKAEADAKAKAEAEAAAAAAAEAPAEDAPADDAATEAEPEATAE